MKVWLDNLGLRAKLVLMMFSLLLLTLASLFVLYWQAERKLIEEVEKHTMDIGDGRCTGKGHRLLVIKAQECLDQSEDTETPCAGIKIGGGANIRLGHFTMKD